MLGDGEIDGVRHVGLVGDVTVNVGNGGELIADGVAALVLDIGDDDLCAVFGEQLGRGLPNSACATGNHRHLPF